MSKTLEMEYQIDKKRDQILNLLSGADDTHIHNAYNYVYHRASDECENLFQYPDYMPADKIHIYLSFSAIHNMQPAWDYIWNNRDTKIDLGGMRQLHSILAQGTDIQGGVYRISDAYVERLQQSAPPYHIMLYKISDIEYALNDENVPAMQRAVRAHYDIIAAQPFNDFNKRTARMVMNWLLLQNNYTPILFNQRTDKHDYMYWMLKNARADGQHPGYIEYMYSCMQRTQDMIIDMLRNSKTQEF